MGLCDISIALFLCFNIVIILISVNFRKNKVLFFTLIILISFIYSRNIKNIYDSIFDIKEEFYVLKIESLKEEVKNYNKYIAKVKSGKYRNFKIYIYSNQEYDFGTVIQCFDVIEKPDGIRNDKRF